MKKKNLNSKLRLSKKTVSNFKQSELIGGTNASENSLVNICIADEENVCNATNDICRPTLGGETCVGLSCLDFTCAGIACPGDPC